MEEEIKKSETSAAGKKYTTTQLVTAIALIVIGLLFCIFRSGMLSVLLTIVGVVLIAVGVFDMFKKNYLRGAIELAVGIIIIACGWTIVDVTLLLLGIVFIVYSIYTIISVAPAIKEESGFNKVMVILNPVLMLIFGILLVVAKWTLGDAICIVIGVIAIIDGVSLLIRK